MAKKLTNKTQPSIRNQLTNNLSSPFTLCFKYKLFNNYTFETLNKKHLKELQSFLDHSSEMTFQQAEKTYRRESDTSDEFQGEQIIHYGFGEKFRIHGIIENGQFVVLRLDPNHKVHKF